MDLQNRLFCRQALPFPLEKATFFYSPELCQISPNCDFILTSGKFQKASTYAD